MEKINWQDVLIQKLNPRTDLILPDIMLQNEESKYIKITDYSFVIIVVSVWVQKSQITEDETLS